MITEMKICFMTLFYSFLQTTSPRQVIFSGKLFTIIIFQLSKFSVNLYTLCFLFYKKYKDPLTVSIFSGPKGKHELISLGTGVGAINGRNISSDGRCMIDLNGLTIARRGLQR